MFVKYYNSNAGESNILEVRNDVFKNELSFRTVHCKMNGEIISIHKDIDIDIIYVTKPLKETIYLTWIGKYSTKYMILNINGIENIKLSVSENILETVGKKIDFILK